MHFRRDLHHQTNKLPFLADIAPGWYEKDEDEDVHHYVKAPADGSRCSATAPLRLAGTHPRRHLRTRVQPRIPRRQLIPGQAASHRKIWPRGSATGWQGLVAVHLLKLLSNALRLQAPTAPGSPSTPLHLLFHHGPTTDASTTSYSAYANR